MKLELYVPGRMITMDAFKITLIVVAVHTTAQKEHLVTFLELGTNRLVSLIDAKRYYDPLVRTEVAFDGWVTGFKVHA